MLTREALFNQLVHPSRHVRAAVARYLGHQGPPEPEALHALLDACARHGVSANRAALWHFVGVRLDAALAARALGLLRSSPTRDDRFALLRLLGTAAIAAFGAWGDLLDPRCPDERSLSDALTRRHALAAQPVEALWASLLRLAAHRVPAAQHEDDAAALVAALLARDDLPGELLRSAIDAPALATSWIVAHLFELAGHRRLRGAVPRFVAALGGEGAAPAALRGLGLVGDPRAATLIEALFRRRGRAFRLDAADALGRLKSAGSEAAALRLLEDEADAEVRAALCLALCRQFSTSGLEVVRGEVAGARVPLRRHEDGGPQAIDVATELAVATLVVDAALAERSRRRVMAGV